MKIEYLEKEKLAPAFGMAYPELNLIQIRSDLPESVQKFLIAHEAYHLTDKAKWWVWREIKANIVGMVKHPVGFMRCAILSLTFERLSFYLQRIVKGF